MGHERSRLRAGEWYEHGRANPRDVEAEQATNQRRRHRAEAVQPNSLLGQPRLAQVRLVRGCQRSGIGRRQQNGQGLGRGRPSGDALEIAHAHEIHPYI